MIRKTLVSAALLAGLASAPAFAETPSVPGWFDPSTWTSGTATATGASNPFDFMNPPAGTPMFSGQPMGGRKLNLATPGEWTVFTNPATAPAMMNPATYQQFMTPAFAMQFANPANVASWMNPAAYTPWMSPTTYLQTMNPMAYMAFMNPGTYIQWTNPANYAAFTNPTTYTQWMNPSAYGIASTTTAGESVNFFDPNAWMGLTQPKAEAPTR